MPQLQRNSRIVLGIDPGLHLTGYGIVQLMDTKLHALDYGTIKLPSDMSIPVKLCTIQEAVRELIIRYSIEALAIETQFVHQNAASALKLGMVRGVALAVACQLKVDIYEYAPSTIKKAATGKGLATKEQMQTMIAMRLELTQTPPADAADALAMAICHLGRQEYLHPLLSSLSS